MDTQLVGGDLMRNKILAQYENITHKTLINYKRKTDALTVEKSGQCELDSMIKVNITRGRTG